MKRYECKAPDCNCNGRGCWAREQNEEADARAMSDASVEAVARAFCKRMGLDPDEYGRFDLGSKHPGYRWQFFIVQAREAIAMSLAVKEVLG